MPKFSRFLCRGLVTCNRHPSSNLAASKLMVFVHMNQEPAIGIVAKRTGVLRDFRSPYSLLLSIQPSQRAVCDFVFPAVSAVEELAVSVIGPKECRVPATESATLMLHTAHGSSSLADHRRGTCELPPVIVKMPGRPALKSRGQRAQRSTMVIHTERISSKRAVLGFCDT